MDLKRYATAFVVVTLFQLHGSLVQTTMLLFQCTSLGTNSYLDGDYSELCYTPTYYMWIFSLGIPMITLVVVGIPVIGFHLLRRNKHRLGDPAVKEKYYFLYMGYKQKFFYWDIVVVLRRSILVVINVGISGVRLQSLMILLVLVLAGVAHMKVYPYENRDANEQVDNFLNRSEAFSLATSFVIFFLAQFLFIDPETLNAGGTNYIQSASVIIIFVLLLFFIYFILSILREWGWEKARGRHFTDPPGRQSMSEDHGDDEKRTSFSINELFTLQDIIKSDDINKTGEYDYNDMYDG